MPVDAHSVMGQNLRFMRRNANMTQAGLAEAMNRMDIPWDRIIVSRVESGRRRLKYQETTALGKILGGGLFDGLPHQTAERMFPNALVGKEPPVEPKEDDPDEIDMICDKINTIFDEITQAVRVILRRHLQ